MALDGFVREVASRLLNHVTRLGNCQATDDHLLALLVLEASSDN